MKKAILLISTLFATQFITQEANAGLIDTIKGWFSSNDSSKSQDSKSQDFNSQDSKNSEAKSNSSTNQDSKSQDSKSQDSKNSETVNQENKVEDEEIKDGVLVFNDGTVVKRTDVMSKLDDIPAKYRQNFKYDELISLVTMQVAYEKVVDEEVKKLKFDEAEENKIKTEREKVRRSALTLHLLTSQVDKMMTTEELKKYYDDMWEKNVKGTNQYSIIIVTVPNKVQADKISKEAKDEASLNKIVEQFRKSGIKGVMTNPIDDFPEANLPPEVIKQVKEKGGKNCIIGPFPIQGIQTLFFIKSVHPAKKQEFTEEMIPTMKQIAKRDFSNKYVNKLIDKYKVEAYNLNKEKIDPKTDLLDNKEKKKNEKQVNLSKVTNTQVIAKIGKTELTVQNLLDMFNIQKIDNELFASMALQLKISIEEVIQSAIKLCIQDKLLEEEVKNLHYDRDPKVQHTCERIEQQYMRSIYFNKNVHVTEQDVKDLYKKYLQSISASDKNDHEIATKVMLYATQEDAAAALKTIKGNATKFNEEFNKKQKNGDPAIDLGYVHKQEAEMELWEAIKTQTAGACCNKVVKVDGEKYGAPDMNYAVVYVADRRQVKLPTYEESKPYFKKIAEKQAATTITDNLLEVAVKTLNGKAYKKIEPELRNKMLITVISLDNDVSKTANF